MIAILIMTVVITKVLKRDVYFISTEYSIKHNPMVRWGKLSPLWVVAKRVDIKRRHSHRVPEESTGGHIGLMTSLLTSRPVV